MTSNERAQYPQSPLTARGGRIITTTHDTTELNPVALELYVLTAGTVSVVGVDGETVTFLEADITALGGRIPFAVKIIRDTDTTATRFLSAV